MHERLVRVGVVVVKEGRRARALGRRRDGGDLVRLGGRGGRGGGGARGAALRLCGDGRGGARCGRDDWLDGPSAKGAGPTSKGKAERDEDGQVTALGFFLGLVEAAPAEPSEPSAESGDEVTTAEMRVPFSAAVV